MIDPSILRAMLAAGATAEMIVVAVEAAIEADRAKWRERKMSQRQGGVSPRKEKVSHTLPKEKLPPVCSSNKHTPTDADFDAWWNEYPRREDKRRALKAYRHALKRGATVEQLLEGARREAKAGKEREFTKLPASWLNADSWANEDAPNKPSISLVASSDWDVGAKRQLEARREEEKKQIPPEEREANLKKLTTFVNNQFKWDGR